MILKAKVITKKKKHHLLKSNDKCNLKEKGHVGGKVQKFWQNKKYCQNIVIHI